MKKCIVCGAPLMEPPLLMCDNMPAGAQNMPSKEQLPQESGIQLNLCQCSGCGLVQLDCTPVDYYRDVIRAGGYTSTMVDLRREEYSNLISTYGLEGKKIIEIGCGQGEFLNILKEFPVKAYGIEHNDSLANIARESGLNVENNFAGDESTVLKGGPFDAFLSFNFMEHQPNPNGMMRCIYNNLVDGGYGLITVPSFEYILENDSFYELLRDHIANYTEGTLRFLLEKNGFCVLSCCRINRDTLEMVVQKRIRIDVTGLKDNFGLLTEQMKDFVEKKAAENKSVAVWGASHQGFTAVSTTGTAENISYIIDSAPFKQGKYAPASHLPIVSPEYFYQNPVDTVLIIAPGYTNEIADIIKKHFRESIEIAALKSAKIELIQAAKQ